MVGTQEAYARHRKESGLIGGTRAAVQKALKRGRITKGSNGLIDFDRADRDWEERLIHCQRRIPRSMKSEMCGAERVADSPPDDDQNVAAYRLVLDTILERRGLVPGILAAIGVRDLVLLHAADDIFCTLVAGLACKIDELVYPVFGTDYPSVEVDIKGVFKKHGLRITPKVVAAADKMSDAVYLETEKAVAEKG